MDPQAVGVQGRAVFLIQLFAHVFDEVRSQPFRFRGLACLTTIGLADNARYSIEVRVPLSFMSRERCCAVWWTPPDFSKDCNC